MGVMFPELAYHNNTFDNLKFVNKWLSKHFTIEAQFIKIHNGLQQEAC